MVRYSKVNLGGTAAAPGWAESTAIGVAVAGTWLGPITAVTVVTDDVSRSVWAYGEHLGYQIQDQGRIEEGLARAWAAPRTAGAPWVMMGPASGIGGSVRLVKGPVPPEYRPAHSLGWAAMEINVPDVAALAARLEGSCFRTLVPPAPLAGLTAPALHAMQSVGPSGELVYFTEISGPLPQFDLPRSSGAIDGVFIAVVAAANLAATRGWFETRFDLHRASDRQVAIEVVNASFGLPKGTLHRISTLQLRGRTAIEHDQYPASAKPRRAEAGHLPPGVASVAMSAGLGPASGHRVLIGPDGLRVELLSD